MVKISLFTTQWIYLISHCENRWAKLKGGRLHKSNNFAAKVKIRVSYLSKSIDININVYQELKHTLKLILLCSHLIPKGKCDIILPWPSWSDYRRKRKLETSAIEQTLIQFHTYHEFRSACFKQDIIKSLKHVDIPRGKQQATVVYYFIRSLFFSTGRQLHITVNCKLIKKIISLLKKCNLFANDLS